MTTALADLPLAAWVLLAIAAVIVGVTKTAIPGLGTLAVILFAAALPAKASTAALLLLLIAGDAFALTIYRRHADWRTLLRLLPAVAAGMLVGAVFLAIGSDEWVRRGIGAILLALMAITLWQRRRARTSGAPVRASDDAPSAETARAPERPTKPQPDTSLGVPRLARATYGSLAGFTTMVANAGGAAMSMYFLAARMPVHTFLGTAAWFFAVVNLSKVPVALGLGLLTPQTLLLDLLLLPALLVGVVLGLWIARRMTQQFFEWAVIVATVAGAIYLLLSSA